MVPFALAVATGLYSGYVPVAPGTAGSIVGLLVFAAVRATGSGLIESLALVGVIAIGIWSAGVAERHFGRTDPGPVVIDEVAGMLVTLFLLPVGWIGVVVAFLAFRVFDIVKPFPAGRLEGLPGGWGIMCDDLMAGVYAHLLIRLLVWTGLTL